uniref:Uncharacterized protein n=1 Tax=Glossina austeni TaxID=7395 RepID=A0A1A9VU26_GLOAU
MLCSYSENHERAKCYFIVTAQRINEFTRPSCGSACEFDDVNLSTAAGFSIQFLVVIFVDVLLRLANKCLRPISIAVSAGVTVVQLGVSGEKRLVPSSISECLCKGLHQHLTEFPPLGQQSFDCSPPLAIK